MVSSSLMANFPGGKVTGTILNLWLAEVLISGVFMTT